MRLDSSRIRTRASCSGTTDTTGVVEIEARAGEAASGVLVNVTIEQPQGTIQTLSGSFTVKQADFSELASGSDYALVGETATHPRNHFGTDALITTIQQLAPAARSATKTLLYPNGLCLAVDDMSLETGGVFDTKTVGTEPHCTHRRGVDVDIRGFADCATGQVVAGVEGKSKVEQFVLRISGKEILNQLVRGKGLPLTPANEDVLHYRVSQ